MSFKEARNYWNDFYTAKPYSKGKAPSEFLQKMLPRLSTGKILDVAMGEGVNSVYLAQKGFEVVGFDVSTVAVEHAEQLAKDTGVKLKAKAADLDLYLMGLMEYDSVIMTYFRPSVTRYYSNMITALKQGGSLLIESYGIPEMGEAIAKGEAYRNYFFSSNEVINQLRDMRILFYQEAKVGGKHVVQCLAQKPYDRHAAKHDVFGMHTGKPKGDSESLKHLELAEKFFKKE